MITLLFPPASCRVRDPSAACHPRLASVALPRNPRLSTRPTRGATINHAFEITHLQNWLAAYMRPQQTAIPQPANAALRRRPDWEVGGVSRHWRAPVGAGHRPTEDSCADARRPQDRVTTAPNRRVGSASGRCRFSPAMPATAVATSPSYGGKHAFCISVVKYDVVHPSVRQHRACEFASSCLRVRHGSVPVQEARPRRSCRVPPWSVWQPRVLPTTLPTVLFGLLGHRGARRACRGQLRHIRQRAGVQQRRPVISRRLLR
jgi:hypothetical protein